MEKKEYAIGEEFYCDGKRLRCVEDTSGLGDECKGCVFDGKCEGVDTPLCIGDEREDGNSVMFIPSESCLLEAERILNGGRQADYGDAVDNFKHIASVVNAALRRDDITPELCSFVHIATKLCREGNKHKRDNLVDLAAYSEILNQINNDTILKKK